jgi:DNA-binding transcriptional regulator of glucitol operon
LVRSKYFSLRAIGLHVALILWILTCALAAWWQVGRAIQGNSLSYLYSLEWPVIGLLGVLGWYSLLNAEKVGEHQEKARREFEEKMRADAQMGRELAAAREAEDPSLAAYNDHLAQLAQTPKKRLWGH